MIIDPDSIDLVGFDHKRSRSRQVELPTISKVCLFRRITEPVNSPPHRNRRSGFNCHEEFVLWVMISGRGALLVGDSTYTVENGEAILVFPWQSHFRIPLTHDRADWLLIRFSASDSASIEYLRNRKVTMTAENIRILQNLINTWNHTPSGTDSNLPGSLLLTLLFSLPVDTTPVAADIQNSRKFKKLYIKELCELLMNDASDRNPFETIANKWSITPEYLHVVFRKHMGRPAREFITDRKIANAKHLLANSGILISDIAQKTGFQSVYAFSRFFKKHCGTSPSEYRKQYIVDQRQLKSDKE